MNPWAIPMIMSVFGAYLGYKGGADQKDQARKQKDLAKRNAALGQRELEEQIRRQSIEDMRLRASSLARSAASGAEVGSGTNAANAESMLEEQTLQLNWLRTAGASEIRLQLDSDMLRAEMTKTGGENQQWSSIIQGAMGAFAFADKGGMMDWGGTTVASPYASSASGFRIAPGGGFQ